MTKTKILILHTSVGYGIKVTAENIFEELNSCGLFEVRIEDVQKVDGGKFGKILEKLYSKILDKFSFIWGFLYSSKIILWLSLPLRKPIAGRKSKKVLELLREFQPAIVISTQTASTGIVAYLKSKSLYRGKLVAVISDFHIHRFWLYKEVDLYTAVTEEQVAELKTFEIPEKKIVLTGMFVGKKFFKSISKDQAKAECKLLSSMPAILLTSGARIRNETKELYTKLLRSPKSFQVMVVCGRNEELKNELSAISAPSNHPVKIFGFVDNMEILMTAADVLVGKTGGPTIGEAVVKKLPMVLTQVRPGHEEKNLEYLVRHGIVQYARIPREVVFLLEEILAGKLKTDWEKAFNKLIKPKDSEDLVAAVNQIKPEEEGAKIRNYQDLT